MHESSSSVPIGLLSESDLISRFPARREEVIAHAIARREEEMIGLRETRKLLSWHPVQLIKTLLIVGIVAFSLAWMFSQIAAFGHWYAGARASKLVVAIPMLGNESFPVGQYLPTSTAMTTIQTLPMIGLNESIWFAIAVMGIVLLERGILITISWNRISQLHQAERQRKDEIELLRSWRA